MIASPRRTGDIAGILALVAALAALGGVVYLYLKPDAGGSKGLAAYDFSTPEKALKAEMEIVKNNDAKAMMEYMVRERSESKKQEVETLEIKQEADFQDKKLIFYSVKLDGKPEYRVQGFRKHPERGIWVRDYIGEHQVRPIDKDLADQMRNWQMSGKLKAN